MKYFFSVLFILLSLSTGILGKDLPGEISISPTIDLYGCKYFGNASRVDSNNLEEFYGRINFVMSYSYRDKLSSGLYLRLYPAGYGYDFKTDFSFDDESNDIKADGEMNTSKMQVFDAWVKYNMGAVALKAGRWLTIENNGFNYGNYIDQGTGGTFDSRGTIHNATEFSTEYGRGDVKISTSAMLIAGDKHLNTGYLRLVEDFMIREKLNLRLGYRANLFDNINSSDQNADMMHRFSFISSYTIKDDFKPFMELGIHNRPEDVDEYDIPVTAGVILPAGDKIDNVIAEFEVDGEQDFLWSLSTTKHVGELVRIMAGVFADPQGNNADDLGFSLQIRSGLIVNKE
ncbi:MAG: hypothetical protein ACQEQV_07100 [Fibrobacterota bacterium]